MKLSLFGGLREAMITPRVERWLVPLTGHRPHLWLDRARRFDDRPTPLPRLRVLRAVHMVGGRVGREEVAAQ